VSAIPTPLRRPAVPQPLPVRRPAAAPKMDAAKGWIFQLAFLAVHTQVAQFVAKRSSMGLYYAAAIAFVGAALAITTKRFDRIAAVVAYVMGVEVFLRMRAAPIPWEYAKFTAIILLGIGVVRMGHLLNEPLAYAYFALLLPSVMLTVDGMTPMDAREAISFNLSGPLALSVAVLFFSGLRLTVPQLRWILICGMAPTITLAAAIVRNLSSVKTEIEFGGSSNWMASGGFGPNQVASALALGALCAIVYLLLGSTPVVMMVALLGAAAGLLGLSALTFTRGGIYTITLSLLAGSVWLLRDKRLRKRVLQGAAALLLLIVVVVVPRLLDFTNGVITSRFERTDTSGRDTLVYADLVTFTEHPILGAGPGMGIENRTKFFGPQAAHTEYSRLLGEHGLLGLIAIVTLAAMALRALRKSTNPLQRALVTIFMVWMFLYLMIDATRVLAPSFLFGLAFASFVLAPRRPRKAAAPRLRPLRLPQQSIRLR
jgi:O-antigen ligase